MLFWSGVTISSFDRLSGYFIIILFFFFVIPVYFILLFFTIAVILFIVKHLTKIDRFFACILKIDLTEWMDGRMLRYMIKWIDRKQMNVACESQKIFHSTRVTILIS